MDDKLCMFCTHFRWSKEEMWGMGSTLTGPMFSGGDAACKKGHGASWCRPENEGEFREIILTARQCPDYDEVKV